jgi:ADP-ribose pyrophosphatase
LDVVAAVFTDQDFVLACRRRPHLRSGGRWEFPGGKVEPGEEPAAGLLRELREELDVEAEIGALLDRTTTWTADGPIRLACFLVRALTPLPATSPDHDVISWFDRARLAALDWAEPDRPAMWKLIGG